MDALGRGLASLRANWPLVGMFWLQNLVVTVVFALGLVVPVLVVGVDRFRGVARWDPEDIERFGFDLVDLLRDVGPALIAGLVAASVVWLLAGVLFAWFQAGFFGVLVSADRQAPPGRSRGWRLFRTFSLQHFAGWGARYLWRFFWFWNVYCCALLGWLLVAALLAWGTVFGAQRWGTPAAVGIGCGGSLPLVFVLLVLVFWLQLSLADLARENSGVGVALRRGWRVLMRRPGAVLAIFALFFVVSLVLAVFLGLAFAPLGLLARLAGEETRLALVITVQVTSQLVQWLATAVVGVAFSGAWVALVGSEAAREEPAV